MSEPKGRAITNPIGVTIMKRNKRKNSKVLSAIELLDRYDSNRKLSLLQQGLRIATHVLMLISERKKK